MNRITLDWLNRLYGRDLMPKYVHPETLPPPWAGRWRNLPRVLASRPSLSADNAKPT